MDSFSRLPDEIIVLILSFLPTKSAAKTSILSKRWRNLWKLTARLSLRIRNGDDHEHIQLVDSLLSQFQNPNFFPLRELSIEATLDTSINITTVTLNRWISSAIDEHNVKILNMSLSLKHDSIEHSFPLPSSCNRSNNLMHLKLRHFEILPSFEFFRNLRSLTLNPRCVVTDDAIDDINLNCTLLERLVIANAIGLVNLRVSSSLRRLKHLEVYFCVDLRTVFIDPPNLTNLLLGYLKFPLHVHHLHVPRLMELTLNCRAGMSKTIALLESSAFENVENLNLIVDPMRYVHFDFLDQRRLNHVKGLSLKMYTVSEDLRGLGNLLRVCPNLESLHFSFGRSFCRRWGSPEFHEPISRDDQMLQSLERIRMEGFDHRDYSQLIVLKYSVEVAPRLAEIRIKVCFRSYDDVRESKRCIKDFVRDKLCRGEKLVILPEVPFRRRRSKRTTKDDKCLTIGLPSAFSSIQL